MHPYDFRPQHRLADGVIVKMQAIPSTQPCRIGNIERETPSSWSVYRPSPGVVLIFSVDTTVWQTSRPTIHRSDDQTGADQNDIFEHVLPFERPNSGEGCPHAFWGQHEQ